MQSFAALETPYKLAENHLDQEPKILYHDNKETYSAIDLCHVHHGLPCPGSPAYCSTDHDQVSITFYLYE